MENVSVAIENTMNGVEHICSVSGIRHPNVQEQHLSVEMSSTRVANTGTIVVKLCGMCSEAGIAICIILYSC